MAALMIECVPNFSEGRRKEVIEAIIEPFRKYKGCALLDYQADENHNRLVVSLIGQPGPIQDALIEAAKVALAEIDMEKHEGEHPRVGAVDVIPFVPIRNADMETCVNLAREFGKRYYNELGVPVYFYEEAALIPERAKLETIRKGQYEVLKNEVITPKRRPDVGEPKLHPTGGATVIGARKFLVAFNVNLSTPDVEVAKQIAKFIRSSSGGLCHVKGIGLKLKERGLVQVSMNLTDFEKNPIYRVTEMIRTEAKRWGVEIVETEICGIIPAAAILDSAAYYLQLNRFDTSQVIELAILDMMEDD